MHLDIGWSEDAQKSQFLGDFWEIVFHFIIKAKLKKVFYGVLVSESKSSTVLYGDLLLVIALQPSLNGEGTLWTLMTTKWIFPLRLKTRLKQDPKMH